MVATVTAKEGKPKIVTEKSWLLMAQTSTNDGVRIGNANIVREHMTWGAGTWMGLNSFLY